MKKPYNDIMGGLVYWHRQSCLLVALSAVLLRAETDVVAELNCAGAMASVRYPSSAISKDNPNLRSFLVKVLDDYRTNFRDFKAAEAQENARKATELARKTAADNGYSTDITIAPDATPTNADLRHVRRMVKTIRNAREEIRAMGENPEALEVGIYLSDVAKNPQVIARYKAEYGDDGMKTFLAHARNSIDLGYKLNEGASEGKKISEQSVFMRIYFGDGSC